MVEEVNKIIYNMLISGRGVYLPGVGTLFIERQGARKISSDRLLSPRNVVNFSSREQGPSLAAEIAAIAGCDEARARDIYDRWLGKVRDGVTLTIGGVGVLNDKSFSAEAAFNAAINPNGVKTLVIRRRSGNGWLYAVCAVCVLIAAGVGVYMLYGGSIFGGMGGARNVPPVESAVPAPVAGQSDSTEVPADAAEPEPVPEAEAAAAADDAPQTSDSLSAVGDASAKPAAATASPAAAKYAYYVVMGVFSTEQNAGRALEQAGRRISDMAGAILPFKDKFIAAVYGSDNRDDCAAFSRSYRDEYPDLWIYSNR